MSTPDTPTTDFADESLTPQNHAARVSAKMAQFQSLPPQSADCHRSISMDAIYHNDDNKKSHPTDLPADAPAKKRRDYTSD